MPCGRSSRTRPWSGRSSWAATRSPRPQVPPGTPGIFLADQLAFPTRSDETVTIAPLAFSLTLERLPGIELFQIVHTAPTALAIRLRPAPDTEPERVWQTVHTELTGLLTDHGLDHGLDHVTLTHSPRTATAAFWREIPCGDPLDLNGNQHCRRAAAYPSRRHPNGHSITGDILWILAGELALVVPTRACKRA